MFCSWNRSVERGSLPLCKEKLSVSFLNKLLKKIDDAVNEVAVLLLEKYYIFNAVF